jgi:hypothetical protein
LEICNAYICNYGWGGNILKRSHLENQEGGRKIKLDLMKIGCEDGRWMKIALGHVEL